MTDSTLTSVELSQKHLISLWDVTLVASAAMAGCERILTEDLDHGQRILDVEIVNPFR